jgi:uncharacterized protein (DUF983 family)
VADGAEDKEHDMTKPDQTAIRNFGDHPDHPSGDAAQRPLLAAMGRGMRGVCPACGQGHVFTSYLSVARHCEACGEELFHQRADDLPAYLNIFVTGHVVVGAMMIFMDSEFLPIWGITLLTAAIAVMVAILMMRPLKGLVVGAQWALRMHGFGGHDD